MINVKNINVNMKNDPTDMLKNPAQLSGIQKKNFQFTPNGQVLCCPVYGNVLLIFPERSNVMLSTICMKSIYA